MHSCYIEFGNQEKVAVVYMVRTQKPFGFTLIELLVVVAIIGILVGLLLPAIQMVREASRRTACSNRVRQCSLAVTNYEVALRRFPSGVTGLASEFSFQSWLQQLLPYVDQGSVLERALDDYEFHVSPFEGHAGLQTVITVYQCPSDPASGRAHWTHESLLVASTNYLGVNGTNYLEKDGVLFSDSEIRLSEITDGTSNTLLMGERPPSPDFWFGWWYTGFGQDGTGSGDMVLGVAELKANDTSFLEGCRPGPYGFSRGQNDQCDALHFWSHHPGGALFGMCDGSVHFISYADELVLAQLATRAGGEIDSLSN